MRNRLFVIVALAGLAGGVLAFVATRRGGDEALAGERVVVAFGDSVAAGQGLGPALGYPNNERAYPARVGAALGWPSRNVAVSSACAATAGRPGSHPDTPDACTTSILHDQLDRARGVFNGSPRLVLITVGANDIQFADCSIEAIVPDLSEGACENDALRRRLEALDANLSLALDRLRQRYPDATIMLTSYYNPMPAPAAEGEDPCPIYEPLAALDSPLSLVSDASLRRAALALQATVHERFRDGVSALNEVIRRVASRAGASVATLDFAGHDLCRSQTGDGEATWVYGPDYDVRFRVTGAAILGGGKQWTGTLPSRCPSPTPAEPEPFSTGEVTRRIGVVEVVYSARVTINCMPHPTQDGQQAIADAVVDAVPPRIR